MLSISLQKFTIKNQVVKVIAREHTLHHDDKNGMRYARFAFLRVRK